MQVSIKRELLRGVKSYITGLQTEDSGGSETSSARYCYSIYMRHIVLARRNGLSTTPRTLVELGPGHTLGVGLMMLLMGGDKYYAIDAVRHLSPDRNLNILSELEAMLCSHEPIPNDQDCAEIKPDLDDYSFPSEILDKKREDNWLSPERLSIIRNALSGTMVDGPISYLMPNSQGYDIASGSIDMVLSQAVMEHVDRVDEVYRECRRWLKPGGLMSHQIDFRCHDTAPAWNGHLAYPDWMWRLICGRRISVPRNRLPCSTHINLIERAGFRVVSQQAQILEGGIRREQLARSLRAFTDGDLRTSGLFVQAVKL